MKKITAIVMSLLAVVVLAVGPSHKAEAATGDWQKAVMIQSRYSTDFASAEFKQSVDNALADGANYIVLVIALHQSNIYSTDVQTGNDTPTDQALQSAITYIHGKGAHVAFNIHDDPYDGQWRAFINPSDRAAWFANYGSFVKHYATLAQAAGVEQLVMGTEMTSMTSPNFNGTNTANWKNMIQAVRQLYGGILTYSAQHSGGMSDLQSIGFWPQLDYIGISAYYGMGNDKSVDAIKSRWAQWNTSSIQPIAAQYGKQVLFTEVGYVSKSNGLGDPGSAYSGGGSYDPTLQANAYQALLDYWQGYSYFAGVAFWDWSSDPNAGGNGNVDYTPQHKPAEQIMKQYFTSGGGQTTPTPPSSPTSFTLANTSPATITAVTTTNLTVTVAANQALTNALVDVEVYAANGTRVAQQFYENQNLSAAAKSFQVGLQSPAAGTYTIKVGVFTANWASNLVWNDNVGTVTAQTTPAPPSNGGGTTTPPATSGSVSVWWPGNNASVSGAQPFKAVLDAASLASYKMYWQVDGGSLNLMGDSNAGAPHKESLVDLSSWNWSGSGAYTINFVAKDNAGTVVAQKSVVITITH
jgi:hypothetical protein